ncbi:recombinase family protein [Ornithinimicrobium humiphilum]|uniref:DNA invertase Pin-like site-specific DNA recombinase n=1 Tax=Ornithinimicrobium humiphilum TaxID=125288 RepID=A0A543KKC6_9MICO|nr:recombinase family protein [Ornithinimicrobium humiphilum]TQM95537.1 DNA invertase Pin-like site-specific DNA recombinase [Ornithinimicrobium humiphilum]
MRIVTYGRVSGREQAESGTSLPEQERRLREWASRDGHTHVEHFSDPGFSGGSLSRPGLTALRQRVAMGDVTMVAVTKADRLARDQLGQLTLVYEFSQQGAAVTAIDEGTSSATAEGQLTANLLGGVAQFERQRIGIRTKEGRRAAAKQGRFVGSTPPFGYRVAGEPRARLLVIDNKQAQAVRYIYEQLVVGRARAKDVADDLNRRGLTPAKKATWDAATLRRWAKDSGHIEAAAGIWRFDDIEVPIPAIITEAEAAFWRTWLREARTVYPQRAPQSYLLTGLLIMPCGRRGLGRTAGRQRPTYSCRARLAAARGHDNCHNVEVAHLDVTVVEHVRQALLQPAVLRAGVMGRGAVISPAVELTRVQAELAALDTQIAEEVALLREHGLRRDALEASVRPLQTQQEVLTARARGLRRKVAEEAAGVDNAQVRRAVTALEGGFDTIKPETWRVVLDALHVVVRIVDHYECEACGGSGYTGTHPVTHHPLRCDACLAGSQPVVEVEMDDVAALAVADGLRASS